IALTAVASGSEIMRGLSAGMEGYLLKKASPVELKEAIAVVGGGGRYVTPEVGGFIAEAYLDKKRASRKTGLDVSAREMEVLELVCQGMRTREVSQVLNISPRTVEKHRDSLRRKFGLRTIAGVATAYLSKKR
ncbi:MAG: response regulator transcription factor, partial [Myxococcota bacterium]